MFILRHTLQSLLGIQGACLVKLALLHNNGPAGICVHLRMCHLSTDFRQENL